MEGHIYAVCAIDYQVVSDRPVVVGISTFRIDAVARAISNFVMFDTNVSREVTEDTRSVDGIWTVANISNQVVTY